MNTLINVPPALLCAYHIYNFLSEVFIIAIKCFFERLIQSEGIKITIFCRTATPCEWKI